MKKLLLLIVSIVLIFSMVACSNTSQDKETNDTQQSSTEKSADGEEIVIKIANWYAESHPQNVSLNKLKEIVETKSEGQMKVEIYPNSQLGSEDTFIESVKKGTVEMGVPGIMMCKEVPKIAIGEMPFLFDGWDHVREVLRGPIGEEIYDGLIEKAGVRPLAWTVNGFREISSNREIKSMEDFEGMRLRLPGLNYYIKMGEALGANVVTNSFSELFTSMEQKVVDGQDNPYATDRASKFNEVQEYILETRHMFSPNIWIVNEEFFQSLSDEQQQILLDAVNEAADHNWDLSEQKDEEDKQWLADNGMKITVPSDEFKAEIVEVMEDNVYDWFYEEYPGTKELAEKIRALTK
jgi:tripartite ATP-independent transporter DctP family solute receptor